MEHLSPEWIAAFDDIVRAHAGLRAASADRRVVISYTVTGPFDAGSGSPVGGRDTDHAARAGRYTLVLDHGDNRVLPGAPVEPDITFRTDRATAAAIASHTESAQRAFLAGRLRLGGDVRVLMTNQDLLAEVDDCAAALRSPADAGGGRGA